MGTFAELWEEAEQIASGLIQDDIIIHLSKLLLDYQKLNQISSPEIRDTLKTKKYGEILYRLTELSRLDNINSFAALKLELQVLKPNS